MASPVSTGKLSEKVFSLMATTFADLYGFIRAILGDNDSSNYSYSNEVLDQHISLNTILLNLAAIQIDDGADPLAFTANLSTTNKALVSLNSALTLINPTSDYFSYKTPIHSVTRSGGVSTIIGWIEDRLADLQGGRFPFACDNELTAMIQGANRFLDAFDDALVGP